MSKEREPQPEIELPYVGILRTCEELIQDFRRNPRQELIDQIDEQWIRIAQEFEKPGKFELGGIFITPGARDAVSRSLQMPSEFFVRHKQGDFGDIDEEDWRTNERAIRDGDRILSAYHTRDNVKLWTITEWDRSATTILLPDEY